MTTRPSCTASLAYHRSQKLDTDEVWLEGVRRTKAQRNTRRKRRKEGRAQEEGEGGGGGGMMRKSDGENEGKGATM